MYNGIGLTTARGSGTNGYVQTNKFFIKAKTNRVADASRPFEAGQGTAGLTKKPNKEILEHDRKRQIELKLVILEDKLTEQGYTESEIADKLVEARKALESQHEKDEEGEIVATPTHQIKVSDTQTHQVAARKEKQLETLRAALGIGIGIEMDESVIPPTSNRKSNVEDRREHSFLDRGGPVATADGDDLKMKKVVKKKGEDEIKNSRHHRKKKEKRSRHEPDTGSDSDSSLEQSKRATHKKSRKVYDSESDSDDFASGRKKKKSSKKHDRRRSYDSDDSESESESDSDTDSDETRKRDHKYKSSHRRHDSSEEDSDVSGGREKKKGEAQRRKIEQTRSHRRGRDNMTSESNTDTDRTRDSDSDGEEGKNRGEAKRRIIKSIKSHRRGRDTGSDSDSGSDAYRKRGSGASVKREKRRGEAQRKVERAENHRRGRENVHSDSGSGSDPERTRNSDSDGGREKKKGEAEKRKIEQMGSHRRKDSMGSDTESERTRDCKKELVKKSRHKYDTEDDSGSDIARDKQVVEEGRKRGGRHDTDDEDSNSLYGRKSSKATAPRHKVARRRSISLTDDSNANSSDEDSDRGGHKHQISKNIVGKDRIGYRGDAEKHVGRVSRLYSQKDEEFASAVAKNDDRMRRTVDEDDRSERVLKSDNNKEMIKGKRKADDEYIDEQPESKSRTRNLGKEMLHENVDSKDTKFDSESNTRTYREKDYRKRDDYSRSVRPRGELDDDNGRQDTRLQSKIIEPHRETRRNDLDYEDRRGGRRHSRDEEEPRGRKHARDELDHKYRSHERDEEQLHGSRRQRREEDDERGNRDRVRDRQSDRYEDARSSERKSHRDDRW